MKRNLIEFNNAVPKWDRYVFPFLDREMVPNNQFCGVSFVVFVQCICILAKLSRVGNGGIMWPAKCQQAGSPFSSTWTRRRCACSRAPGPDEGEGQAKAKAKAKAWAKKKRQDCSS